MTKEERKGKKRKQRAANEAGNKQGPGRPPEPPSDEGMKIRNEKKIKRDRDDRAKKKFISNICETFCEQPKFINEFKIFLEKLRKSIEKSSKLKLEEYKNNCGEAKITKKLKAKYMKRIEKSSKNDGTDEFLDEDTFHYLCDLEMWIGYLAGIGTPSEPPNATAGSSGGPITQSSPHNEEDTCVACPSSHGLEQIQLQHQMSEMQEQLQWIVTVLSQSGFFLQTNAPIVSPAEPHHDPLGIEGGINAAAGSSGGPTTQSSLHNEEGAAEQELEFKEQLNMLEEDLKDTCVACPSSHGLEQIQLQHQMSEMQEQLQWIVTVLSQSGFFLQTNAPIVSPAEPHHDPLGIEGGTNTAAGSSGGPTTQSSLHNEENMWLVFGYGAGLSGISIHCHGVSNFSSFILDMVFKSLLSVYLISRMWIALMGAAEQELEFKEQLNMLEEDLKKDGTNEFLYLEDLEPEMLPGNDFVREKYCVDYGLWVPVTGDPHHFPPGMQGGTTAAAGSSGVKVLRHRVNLCIFDSGRMAVKGRKKITGADEAGNKGGPGRPPLSQEEKMKKKEEKNQKSREIRAYKKSEYDRLLQEEKVFKAFCEEHGVTEVYQKYREKCKKRTEESSKGREEQTREFNEEVDKLGEVILVCGTNLSSEEDCGTNLLSEEGLQLLMQYYSEDEAAAVEENREMLEENLKAGPSDVDSNSGGEWQSSTTLITGGVANSGGAGGHGGIGPKVGTPFERAWELKRKREEELDGARRGKRPATADNYTPPRPPIYGSQPSGFMADADRQTSPQSAAAHLFSTPAWASKWEERLRKLTGEPAPRGNNGARAIMDDFVKLLVGSSISHSIYLAKQYEKLQVKDAERRKEEQEVLADASIDANPKFKEKKKEADDLKKQVEELQEEVSKLQAELAKKDEIISKDVFKQNLAAVSLGWNLMKKLLESTDAGTELLNLSLLDTIKHHPPLLHQFNEGLTSIGQGHINIDDTFCIPFDLTSIGQGHISIDDTFCIPFDLPVDVPGPFVSDQFIQTVNTGGELIGSGPPGDPNVVILTADRPPLQTANTGTNNVDQEGNIANRENKAAEADNSRMGADATFG
ncbi:hypothetical protein SLA2020_067860 [Shorea laevis]